MYLLATYLRTRQSAFCALVLLASIAGAFGQSPPPNDDFANRIPVTGSSLIINGTLAGATYEDPVETANPPPNIEYMPSVPGGGSVWWTWTATQSTTVVIQAVRDNPAIDQVGEIAVYTGSNLNSLTLAAVNGFDVPGRYARFSASAGVSYQFRVWGTWGGPFTLKLTATNPPVFVKQPQDCVVSPHGSALFSSLATGPRPIYPLDRTASYQWSFNGVPIGGEIFPTLVIHNVSTNQAGGYSVIASNVGGITQSATAILTVTDTNPVPRLAALSPTNPALMNFSLIGEGGRWYEYESSQDLKTWGNRVWFQPSNATTVLSIPRLTPAHFVRSSLNSSTDVCVAQLKRMRDSCVIMAIEESLPAKHTVTLANLERFIPLDETGNLPHCPEGGIYSPPASILFDNPTCNIHGHGHAITDP